MKEWEYTFGSVSKKEWIRQIETDLRQKSVDSLSTEWWPGEPLNPILNHEDVGDEMVTLPDHLFDKPPSLIEKIGIDNASSEAINQKILDALQFGTQCIHLQVKDSEVYFHPEWLSNVITEIVTFQIESDFISAEAVYKALQDIPDFFHLRLNRTTSSGSLHSILEQVEVIGQSKSEGLRFVYIFNSTGDIITEATVIFKKIHADLAEWMTFGLSPESFFPKCILRVHPDTDYFKQIVLTRTLHLLWKNLLRWHGIENNTQKSSFLETHLDQNPDEKPDPFLIRASMSGLAASLAGTNALCVHGLVSETNKDFYHRINRNIHHLLYLESGMYKEKDPLAGAYAVDYHTKRWVSKIWSRLSM